MRKLITLLTLVLLLGPAAGAAAQEAPADPAATVLARVGDEVITAADFAREMRFRLREIQATAGRAVNPDERIRRAVMQELINGRILSIAARNAGVEATPEELEKEFADRKAAFKSEEAYQEYLKTVGIDEAALKENIRSRLRVTKFVDQQTGEIKPNDEETQKAYEALKAQGVMTRTEKTRDVAVILLRPDGDTDEAWRTAEERAKAVHARLAAGEDFQTVAREISEEPQSAERGGVIREMKFGNFHPELEAAMDKLEVGGLSDPVRSVMGWYLVTLLAINEPGTIPLDAVRDGIEREVIDSVRKKKIAEIVAETQKLIRIELVEAAPADAAGTAPAEPAIIVPEGSQ